MLGNDGAGAIQVADLCTSPLFDNLSHEFLAEASRRARRVQFPRGSIITRENDPADAFFLLLQGRVEVIVDAGKGSEHFVDTLGRGDCVGDVALLLGQARTATVRALQDCEAARLSADDFAWMLRTSADFTARLARLVAHRLQRTTHRLSPTRPVERILLVPCAPGIVDDGLRRSLAEALGHMGPADPTSRTDRTLVEVNGPDLLDGGKEAELEAADVILFVAPAEVSSYRGLLTRLLDAVADLRPRPRLDLLLVQRQQPYRHTLPWLHDHRLSGWHHVRAGNDRDMKRVFRRCTGRAVGLVLGGGGARGFAHIGVLKAFLEAGIEIDVVAGSSMGAIVAAQHAMGFDHETMLDHMRRAYVETRGAPDYALPYVALRTGRGTDARLKAMFGEARIEDLPTPCFTVSSNLSTAETVVHTTGRLWHAVRASCSVPGLLPPVRWRGGLLVDGGLLDNLPVRAMQQVCAGHVVASDVSVAVEFRTLPQHRRSRHWWSALRPPRGVPSIRQILLRTVQLASVRDARNAGIPADLYLRPPVDDIGMTDFSRLDEIVERGAQHAREKLREWGRWPTR